MAYTINTNIASLQAQQYLNQTQAFQQQTIERVTSGLRIVQSGDDAAGLAIANGYRSDLAVLNQGVLNANDGLSTLQTIDGGMSNISQLLDRARTLATQSASGTFTGDRTVLNNEYQSVMSEIDRQAQAVGVAQGGEFAKDLSVFVGGGKALGTQSAIDNGSVSVDLTQATVDTQSLGLKGVQAVNSSTYNLSDKEVQSIVQNQTNVQSQINPGYTRFRFTGPGFGDINGISVDVNTNNIGSANDLVTAINSAIQSAGSQGTAESAAFQNAGISAHLVTDSTGNQKLAFTSGVSGFEVMAGDQMSNALMGNISNTTTGLGDAVGTTVTGAAVTGATSLGATAQTLDWSFSGGSINNGASGASYNFQFNSLAGETAAAYSARLQTAVANDSTLKAAGITVSADSGTGALIFSSNKGEQFNVGLSGDTAGTLGFGGFDLDSSGNATYNTISGAASAGAPAAADTSRFTFSFNGGAGVDLNMTWTAGNVASAATMQDALNAAINANSTLKAAGLTASVTGSNVTFTAASGVDFRLQASGSSAKATLGFSTGQGAISTTAQTSYAGPTAAGNEFNSYVAGGGYQFADPNSGAAVDVGFNGGIFTPADAQALGFTAVDANGNTHTTSVTLTNTNATSLDSAIDTINNALQNSNDTTLEKLTAVKVNDGGTEKMTIVSTLPSFQMTVGKNADNVGLDSTSTVYASGKVGSGSNSSIDTQLGAQNAVNALATAVSSLGTAQAVVGKGENQFNYAINLAQTQITNLSAAESRIRDADLAAEAANLTKAQILQQAGVAALAQANSAPQQILTLLRS